MTNQLPFVGSGYVEAFDQKRLTKQYEVIRDLMLDGKWRTLTEIEAITGFTTSAVSSQLRNLRKVPFGSHIVQNRRQGNPTNGCWQYRVSKRAEASNSSISASV
jgi:DNA-binding transcriptional regulator GbsR (MarR family)